MVKRGKRATKKKPVYTATAENDASDGVEGSDVEENGNEEVEVKKKAGKRGRPKSAGGAKASKKAKPQKEESEEEEESDTEYEVRFILVFCEFCAFHSIVTFCTVRMLMSFILKLKLYCC